MQTVAEIKNLEVGDLITGLMNNDPGWKLKLVVSHTYDNGKVRVITTDVPLGFPGIDPWMLHGDMLEANDKGASRDIRVLEVEKGAGKRILELWQWYNDVTDSFHQSLRAEEASFELKNEEKLTHEEAVFMLDQFMWHIAKQHNWQLQIEPLFVQLLSYFLKKMSLDQQRESLVKVFQTFQPRDM
jgi:hypothetical protein